jgi:hypothetical protein
MGYEAWRFSESLPLITSCEVRKVPLYVWRFLGRNLRGKPGTVVQQMLLQEPT